MAAIDLAKEANQEKQTSWTGKAIADIVDISQVEQIIVLDSVSSATPQTLSVVIVGILSVVYRSATGDVIEGDRDKIRKFIENGYAVESIDSGVSPTHRQDEVPVIESVIVTKNEAYYRIVIRENEAQITSVAGHGYFAVNSDPD
jgi:hypothetical protein